MGVPATLRVPALSFYGMASDLEESRMGPEWALSIVNFLVGDGGTLIARGGFQELTASATATNIRKIFEYIDASGTSRIVSAITADLFQGTTTLTSKKGALTPTAGNWQFLNFNGKCLGWQASHTPIVQTGTGNFTNITPASGTLPDGNAACAAFGRVWAVDDDKQTIRYCALLDETKWAVADGGGSIDMRSVWTSGMDEVVAIAAFGSQLVVFGKRQIILWADGAGSQLGMNPLNMYVTDTIDHVGALARDCVLVAGEVDILFWSNSGIRSLSRTLQERASPASSVSPANRAYLTSVGNTTILGDPADITSVYFAAKGLALFSNPAVDRTFVFDLKRPTPDGGFVMTEWSVEPIAMASTVGGSLYAALTTRIYLYSTAHVTDFGGANMPLVLQTGFISVADTVGGRRCALKALKAYGYSTVSQSCTMSLDFDLDDGVGYLTVPSLTFGDRAADGIYTTALRTPLGREAEYVSITFYVSALAAINFQLKSMVLYYKPLRLA